MQTPTHPRAQAEMFEKEQLPETGANALVTDICDGCYKPSDVLNPSGEQWLCLSCFPQTQRFNREERHAA